MIIPIFPIISPILDDNTRIPEIRVDVFFFQHDFRGPGLHMTDRKKRDFSGLILALRLKKRSETKNIQHCQHLLLFLWCYFQSEPVFLTASSIAFGLSKCLKSAKHQNIRGPTWTLGHESHVDRHAAVQAGRGVFGHFDRIMRSNVDHIRPFRGNCCDML